MDINILGKHDENSFILSDSETNKEYWLFQVMITIFLPFSNVDEGIWVVGEEGVLNDKISTKTSFRVSVWMNRIMTSQCWESFLRSILKERHCFSFVDKVTSVMSVFKRA